MTVDIIGAVSLGGNVTIIEKKPKEPSKPLLIESTLTKEKQILEISDQPVIIFYPGTDPDGRVVLVFQKDPQNGSIIQSISRTNKPNIFHSIINADATISVGRQNIDPDNNYISKDALRINTQNGVAKIGITSARNCYQITDPEQKLAWANWVMHDLFKTTTQSS